MAFKLVYHAQNDSQWGSDPLGFGTTTLLQEGCAVSSVAMLLSGYGYNETPGSLNKKLKANQGFSGSGIVWSTVSQLYPQVKLINVIRCESTDAPLAEINKYLDRGLPVIVGVDTSPVEGFQSHYVLLYARKGNDYIMLDPWPYRKEETLMERYSKDRPLQRVIQRVVYFEGPGASGPILASSSSAGTSTTTTPVSTGPTETTGQVTGGKSPSSQTSKLFVKVQKNGLRVYESNYGKGKVLSTEKIGAKLVVVEDPGKAAKKIGVAGNWLNVKASSGKRGFVDAGSVKVI